MIIASEKEKDPVFASEFAESGEINCYNLYCYGINMKYFIAFDLEQKNNGIDYTNLFTG